MLRQRCAQQNRDALVEQYTHLCRSESAPRRMLEHGANLFERDAGEPLYELRNLCAVFEILKEGGNRHARAAEHPRSTDSLGIAFDSRT